MNQDTNDTSADAAATGAAPDAAAAPAATGAGSPPAADAAPVATQEPRPASIAGPQAKPLQPRMKATGQRRSKARGAHTNSKKNPGKRAKKGGS